MRKAVLEHLRSALGEPDSIRRERPESVDVYEWSAPDDSDQVILVTVGMADVPQRVPSGAKSVSTEPRTELLAYALRSDAELVADLLRNVAGYPQREHTFLHWWHTLPLGVPIAPGSCMTALYFAVPPIQVDSFATLKTAEGRVDFLWAVPISEAERKLFKAEGADALEDRLEQADVDAAQLTRGSVA